MVTTTDESGAYEFPDLAPGTYSVEIQMFGFQSARKQVQVARVRSPRNGRSSCNRCASESRERSRSAPAAAGRLPRRDGNHGKRTGPDRRVRSARHRRAASANANEAFLVNGSLSNGLQTGQDDFGLRGPVFGMQNPPGGLPIPSAKDSPDIPGAPAGPGGGVSPAAVAAEGADSVAGAEAVADLAVDAADSADLVGSAVAAVTADLSATAPIAAARAFMAMSRSSGRAPPPMPSSFPSSTCPSRSPTSTTTVGAGYSAARSVFRICSKAIPHSLRSATSALADRASPTTWAPCPLPTNWPEIFPIPSLTALFRSSTIPIPSIRPPAAAFHFLIIPSRPA